MNQKQRLANNQCVKNNRVRDSIGPESAIDWEKSFGLNSDICQIFDSRHFCHKCKEKS